MKGFTLIELLIVLLIISILGGIGLVLFQDVQKTARDGKRKQDIRSIQLALEAYYKKNDRYPCSSKADIPETGPTSDYWNASYQDFSEKFWIRDQCKDNPTIEDLQAYITELPRDPKNTSNLPWASAQDYSYAYLSIAFPKAAVGDSDPLQGCPKGDGQYYILVARLETDDKEVEKPDEVRFCNGDWLVETEMLPILGTDDVNNLLILTSQE